MSHADCSVVILIQDTNPILMASIDRQEFCSCDRLEAIPAYAEEKQYFMLFTFDSNCHSVLYGDCTNPRGEESRLLSLDMVSLLRMLVLFLLLNLEVVDGLALK